MHSCRWGSFEIGGKSILSIMSLGWHSLLTFIGSLKSQDDLLWCLDNLEVFFRGHERKARAMNHAFLFSLNSVWFKVFLIHFLIQEAQLLMLIIKICFSFHAKQKKKSHWYVVIRNALSWNFTSNIRIKFHGRNFPLPRTVKVSEVSLVEFVLSRCRRGVERVSGLLFARTPTGSRGSGACGQKPSLTPRCDRVSTAAMHSLPWDIQTHSCG